MNKLTLGALMLAAAGAAFADDSIPDTAAKVPSLKTRSQVQQELAQAQRDGSSKVWSTSYNHLALAPSVKTRAQVRSELDDARDVGEPAAQVGEDSGALFAEGQRRPASERFAQWGKSGKRQR